MERNHFTLSRHPVPRFTAGKLNFVETPRHGEGMGPTHIQPQELPEPPYKSLSQNLLWSRTAATALDAFTQSRPGCDTRLCYRLFTRSYPTTFKVVGKSPWSSTKK